jgi:hypothetical protein
LSRIRRRIHEKKSRKKEGVYEDEANEKEPKVSWIIDLLEKERRRR